MNPSLDPDAARLRYRLLTGTDDREFCERVSQALGEGYRLYGSPAINVTGGRTVVAQAVVRDDIEERPIP